MKFIIISIYVTKKLLKRIYLNFWIFIQIHLIVFESCTYMNHNEYMVCFTPPIERLIFIGINTHLVLKLFRKVQFGTRTLRMFNLVPQFSKEIQFGHFR